MFRDTGAGDDAEKKGQDKGRMQDDLLTKEQSVARVHIARSLCQQRVRDHP
mgnify:CR=1 FL=1